MTPEGQQGQVQVKALNTWAHCAFCSRRILPIDVLCSDCESTPRGKAHIKRADRRDARRYQSRYELALHLAAFHRQEALKWLKLAKEVRP